MIPLDDDTLGVQLAKCQRDREEAQGYLKTAARVYGERSPDYAAWEAKITRYRRARRRARSRRRRSGCGSSSSTTWLAFLDRLARALQREGAHARRRPPHDRHSA